MTHLYWLIVALVLGACVGSFVNVIIYRWPRDLSLRRPARSFCPHCDQPIAAYDNIPVISFLLLRGRCRHCQAPISLQYPLVELATALVFVMTYDAFFVVRQRLGIGELATDWPMLLAHWVLWAGLIALAVMDLEAYLVDVRVTWWLALTGAIGHTIWTPASSVGKWIRPTPEQAGFTLAVAVGLSVGGLLFLRHAPEPEPESASEDEPPVDEPLAKENLTAPSGGGSLRWLWLLLPAALLVTYVVLIARTGESSAVQDSWSRSGAAGMLARPGLLAVTAGSAGLGIALVFAFFGLALVASHPQPEADSDIVEAIHEEAPESRRNALQELKLLAPAIVLGAGTIALLGNQPGLREYAAAWLHWTPVGQWQPLWGLSTAVTGWVLGGAIGWLARIVSTLLLGKEGLGMGDVHILAAAGAIAGWPVAFIGFFAAAPLTLLALLVIRLRRQSRALPYGPWLGLAFLAVGMFQDHILVYLGVRDLFS